MYNIICIWYITIYIWYITRYMTWYVIYPAYITSHSDISKNTRDMDMTKKYQLLWLSHVFWGVIYRYHIPPRVLGDTRLYRSTPFYRFSFSFFDIVSNSIPISISMPTYHHNFHRFGSSCIGIVSNALSISKGFHFFVYQYRIEIDIDIHHYYGGP